MGYLDIRSRENIDSIMADTLSDYFHTTVVISNQYKRGSFILCPRLNTAVFDRTTQKVKQTVQRSHAVHRNALLKSAMSMFIRIAFSRHGMFGCKYIMFNDIPDHAESLLIMPGNMKIKIFDFQKGVVTNVLKAGFEEESLKLEKEIRINTDKKYILPLKMEQQNVYCEELVQGRSFDRLENHLAASMKGKVEEILLDIQQGNRTAVACTDYLFGQIEIIKKLLDQLNCEHPVKERILLFAEHISKYANGTIILSDSHGDFQFGNIFVSDDGRIYILDWETYAVRSIGYDLLTFFYKFRYRGDYLRRIDDYLNADDWNATAHKFGIHSPDKRTTLSVYFVEDMIWLLKETLSTPEKRASAGIVKYSESEFQQAVIERLEKCR